MDLQALPVVAADCSQQLAAVEALSKDVDALHRQIKVALNKLDAAERDIQLDLKQMADIEKKMKPQSDRAKQELNRSGTSSVASTAVAMALPPIVTEVVAGELQILHGLGQKAHTAAGVYKNFRDLVATARALEEMSSHKGGLGAAHSYAVDKALNELKKLIDQESALAALGNDLSEARSRWWAAAHELEVIGVILQKKEDQLAAAYEALIACLKKPVPAPVPEGCATPVSSGNTGGGHCR